MSRLLCLKTWVLIPVALAWCALAARAAEPAPLIQAAKAGDAGAVERLAESGRIGDINARDGRGRTALHYAIEGAHVETAEILMRHGADLNVRDSAGQTPLHLAAEKRHTATMEALLGRGADPNVGDRSGQRPLHLSALKGEAEAVHLLLRYGASPAVRDNRQRTPLDLALSEGRTAAAERLRSAGAPQGPKVKAHVRESGPGGAIRVLTWAMIIPLAIVSAPAILALIFAAGVRRSRARRDADQTARGERLQRLLQGVEKMEQRIRNLEDIVLSTGAPNGSR